MGSAQYEKHSDHSLFNGDALCEISWSIVADEAATPRGHFLHVRYRFLKHGVMRSDDADWQVTSDKRERPPFQLPLRIAFRVKVP
jgi:hypothetical protein